MPRGIEALHSYLSREMAGYQWRILIADNGSIDCTLDVARDLSAKHSCVEWIHLDQKGRGRALHKAWTESEADIMCYMDVDLSTRLDALPELARSIEEGWDVVIGSRLTKESRVERRTLKREVLSRGYNLLIKSMFWTRFSDAQCGFKAISRKVAQELVPLIEDKAWFFDTELLIIAEKNGYLIRDIPIHWVDDPDTRVKIVGTAYEDLKGLLRLRLGGIPKPFVPVP